MKSILFALFGLSMLATACSKGTQQPENTDSTATAGPAAAPSAQGANGYQTALQGWAPAGFKKASDYFAADVSHPNYTLKLVPDGAPAQEGVTEVNIIITQYAATEANEAPDFRSLEMAQKFFTEGQATAQVQNPQQITLANVSVLLVPVKAIANGTGQKSDVLFLRAIRPGTGRYYTIQCAVTRAEGAANWVQAEALGRKAMEHILSQDLP